MRREIYDNQGRKRLEVVSDEEQNDIQLRMLKATERANKWPEPMRSTFLADMVRSVNRFYPLNDKPDSNVAFSESLMTLYEIHIVDTPPAMTCQMLNDIYEKALSENEEPNVVVGPFGAFELPQEAVVDTPPAV